MAQKIICRLAIFLNSRNKTIADFAKETGLAYNTVKRLCDNSFERLEMGTLVTVCEALKVAPGDLLVLEDESVVEAFQQTESVLMAHLLEVLTITQKLNHAVSDTKAGLDAINHQVSTELRSLAYRCVLDFSDPLMQDAARLHQSARQPNDSAEDGL